MRELDRITYDAVLLLIRALKAEVLLCEDLLREFARRILHLSNEFNSSRQPTTEADEALIRSLKEHHLELTRRLDSELTPALVRKHMSLSDLLNANSDVWTNLVSTMRTTAQRLAGSVIDRMQVLTMIQRAQIVNMVRNIPASKAFRRRTSYKLQSLIWVSVVVTIGTYLLHHVSPVHCLPAGKLLLRKRWVGR